MKLGILAVAVAALLALPAAAGARTFTVTSVDGCGGAGTLQAAINAANASPGADTVDFAPSVQSIGLGSCPMRSAEGNSFAMYVRDDLTIQGPVAIRGLLWWLDQSGNVGTADMPPSSALQIATNTGFLQVGAYGDSAKAVHVTVNRVDVLPEGVNPGYPGYWSLPAYALVNPNSSLTVNRSRIEGIIDAAQDGPLDRRADRGGQERVLHPARLLPVQQLLVRSERPRRRGHHRDPRQQRRHRPLGPVRHAPRHGGDPQRRWRRAGRLLGV